MEISVIEAFEGRHFEVLISLIENPNTDLSTDDNYLIRQSSKFGFVEIVKKLLESGRVDPSADNNYALKNARQRGHKNIAELLLKDWRVESFDKSDISHGVLSNTWTDIPLDTPVNEKVHNSKRLQKLLTFDDEVTSFLNDGSDSYPDGSRGRQSSRSYDTEKTNQNVLRMVMNSGRFYEGNGIEGRMERCE